MKENRSSTEIQIFFIYLSFHTDFSEENDPLVFLRSLQTLGKTVIIPHASSVPTLEEYESNKLYIQWTVKLSTKKSQKDIEEVLQPAIENTQNAIKIEQVTLPPPDPNVFNQALEEKLEFQEIPEKKLHSIETEKLQPVEYIWFKVGRNIFNVKKHYVVQSMTIKETILTENGEKYITIQKDKIPLSSLHALLRLPEIQDFQQMSVLILQNVQKRRGFLIDEVISPPTVKNIEIKEDFSHYPYIAGANLLENNEIAFQLNVSHLIV